ncbi:O-glucosyltransferase rumi-like protein (DUF821) [Tasmannia lanceolata]|uniref:O-glucosyltransferase rumi-like protein (DUF821) n=1 Tax=Tasmannia lanceolata TaxID=3420 RepID=UPI00406425E3
MGFSRNVVRLPRNSPIRIHNRNSKNPNSNIRSYSIPSLASPIFPGLVLLAFFSFAVFLGFHKVDKFISETKTIAGHNLAPTPWHRFPPKIFNNGTASFTTIFHCSYLSCRISSSTHTKNQKLPSPSSSSPLSCPSYFQWIHQDLAPWALSRISIANLMEARDHAAFRIIISNGRLYADFYYACVQTRAMFTVWGLLQLLQRYPGMVPDVDLMFDCMDRPVINKSRYKKRTPPPLFRYCTTQQHFDIPFPDWSFWGWPEVNIGPWDEEFKSIKLGSQSHYWTMKRPTAYWKGNPDVNSPVREKLLSCNDSRTWGAEIMRQNWVEEAKAGYEQSKLANQCNYRYKIYAEGFAWSVSLKYIVSCGSLTLIVDPVYEDFFSRGLMPRQSYWPVSPTNLCQSVKFAVDWGNEHPVEAELIGRRGQDYMNDLNMEQVYDYMYHLIVEYSKLQDFKPVPPSSAQEVCVESLLCFADTNQRKFLERSSASLSSSYPCSLPSPNHQDIERWIKEKQEIKSDIQRSEKAQREKGSQRSVAN